MSHTFTRALVATVLVSGTTLGSGCGVPPTNAERSRAQGWIVTQAPVGRRSMPSVDQLPADPNALYPNGTRIVWVDASSPAATHRRVLSGDLVAAGAPSLTLAGDAVLFTGKASDASAWSIYRSPLDSPAPRIVLNAEGDCRSAREMAHHRLVAACRTHESAPAWSLYTAAMDGSDPQRITFGPGSAIAPFPLRDGRILFSLEQRPGTGRPVAAFALFTLNPDGTMLEPFSGSHRSPAIKHRARQADDDGVFFLASGGSSGATASRVEMRAPHVEPTPAWSTSAGVELSVPTAIEPLAGGDLLVAATGTSSTAAVYRITAEGEVALAFDDPEWDELEAISTRPPAAPRGRPSGRQPGRDTATLIGYDAARGDGEVGPAHGSIRPSHVAIDALRSPGSDEVDRAVMIDRARVHHDGSFIVEVPTDLPIRVRSLDAEGSELYRSDWFWMRPGEVRACFGCHEDRASAPLNRVVNALADSPAGSPEVRSR